ncbi:MAG: DUF1990 domain-containing protein [Candidatus Hydrogenedentes bacterium]|nr:DUF1990 domain-containing protein [Candidatus Hydrogenedentota bacterium]
MWHLWKPSDEIVRAFLDRQRALPLTYAAVGGTRAQAPPGYDLDHNRIQIGAGRAAFDAGCEALRQWKMFPPEWTRIFPPNPPIREEQALALLAHAMGFYWLNASRIVYVIQEEKPVRRFGFAYGTLPEHVERGEERFLIEWLEDDTVWYDIRAFSQPRYWMVRLGYPVARSLQRRFARESKAAMQQAVRDSMASEA